MLILLSLPLLRRVRRRRSVILCYHGIAPSRARDDPKFLQTDPRRFRAQVELLAAAGFEFVTVSAFAARAEGGEPPPGLVALSFDDGWADNHSVLLPILREHGLPATIYVTTGLIGDSNPFLPRGNGARMLTVDELRELSAAGVELGAHTVSHPDLATLERKDCLGEMIESRAQLEEITGKPITTFAYPYGHHNDETVSAAVDAGFHTAVSSGGNGSWDPHQLKRQVIIGKDGLLTFLLKFAGWYGPLSASPPGRVARAATRGLRRRSRRLWEARG